MKKWIASVVAGAMLAAACMGGASAAVLEQDTPSGSAVVRTSCEVEYSVVIPADVEIPFGALDTALGHVYADVMKLEAGMGVYVAVASQEDYRLMDAAGAERGIAYALEGAGAICFDRVNDPTRFSLNARIAQQEWDAAYAGDYEDTLLFTVSYEALA